MGLGVKQPECGPLTTSRIAWRLLPLFFTHLNQALLTTLPFTVAVYMVRDFEAARGGGIAVSEETVGRLTGMLAAAFCAAQLVTSYPWGIISDRIGRKPVMVIGNISCVVSTVAFGLSRSYHQAVLARIVGGALNAIILAEKSMIGEGLPDKESQAKAFGLFSLCWGLGSLAGPMLGGALSAPCSAASPLRMEALCRHNSLLLSRPYFLPCFLAAILSAIAAVMVVFGLEETLPSRRSLKGSSSSGSDAKAQQYQAVPTAEAELAELGQVRKQQRSPFGAVAGDSPRASLEGAQIAEKIKPLQRLFRGDSAAPECLLRGDGGADGSARAASLAVPDSGDASLDLEAAVVELELRQGSKEGWWGTQAEYTAASPTPAAAAVDDGATLLTPATSQPISLASSSDSSFDSSGSNARNVLAAEASPEAELPWYKQRAMLTALLGYGLIAFMYNMLDEITPIFASALVREGGLGFAPSQLAPSLSFGGLVLVGWALWGYPWLIKRVGVMRMLRLGLWQTVPLVMAIPLASLFGGAVIPSQAVMLAAMAAKAIVVTNAFTGCLLLVNDCAPVNSLGAVNGAGQSIASLVRSMGPALGGLLWGWSTQLALPGWLPHQLLPFSSCAVLALGTLLVYRRFSLPGESPK